MSASLKVGLVLSGGGAKGAYQVGVLKALRELGTRIDAVSGASIGALNGGILASAPSLDVAVERLEQLWGRLSKNSPLTMKVPGYVSLLVAAGLRMNGAPAILAAAHGAKRLAQHFDVELPEWLDSWEDGFLDDKPLQQLMDEFLVSKYLEHGLPLYVSLYKSLGGVEDVAHAVCAELGFGDTPHSTFFHVQSIADETEQKRILLASAALPLLFKSHRHEGQRWSDGGQGGWQSMQGNTPITPLLEAGCNLVIVTHLSDGSVWSRQRFPDATILEIRPTKSLARATGPLAGARDLLGFDGEKIPSWIEQGYQDTLHCVGRVLDAQRARNELQASEAALVNIDCESNQADQVLTDAMARLK
ncbi:patatin-like phospholipase family protein [Pseudomonas sp. KFB-139]|uniref:Patatin-like phospholipase family protein n=1 Tax=Pseudomonas serbiensis TaxID=3064350 RepID=A0ABT9CIV1_9PSED|nr:patatin-like phospholipase family protein [Pseudomonas sp. KFB-138]MDO7925404.1 patatin-like phospholipase family protein [Pseudomonas sp. KFB-138]